MKKKKIICTVTNDLNYDQRMHKICGSLSRAGYHVALLGRKKRSSGPLAGKEFGQKRLYCFFKKGKLFYIEYNIRLFFYLLFSRFDVVCAVDLDTIMPALAAARLKGKKIVYDAHEYFTEVPEVVTRPAVQRIWQWVERFAVPKMHACITVSESLGELYRQKYGKEFIIVRNVPVLKGECREEEKPATPFILYQGALNQGRGLEALIESMQQLPMRLVLAGEGDLSRTLRQLAQDKGVADKVEFLGWVSPEKLRELTPKAFIGYNLLENLGLSYYYSLSNKFFDYIHACVPSLSNDFPEYKNINGRYEVSILTNLCSEDIVHNINRALKEREYYNSLINNCREARQHYNWQAEEKKLVQLYGSL